MIDFSKCQEKANRYLGSEKKKTIMYEGKQYLVKFPDPTRDKKNELSYINNVHSEYTGCHIFESAGIPVQDTLLGLYSMPDGTVKTVCACQDFTNAKTELIEFDALFISNIELEKASSTEINDITRTLLGSKLIKSPEDSIKRFWDIFIIDALIGNTDRHNANWGFLSSKESEMLILAPVYDCGSSLLPLTGEETINALLNNKIEFKNISLNIYSCLREDGKRINYSTYFRDIKHANIECRKALMRIYPKIDMKKIAKFISGIEGMSSVRKEFYTKFLYQRYENILQPAYENQRRVIQNNRAIRNTTAPEL